MQWNKMRVILICNSNTSLLDLLREYIIIKYGKETSHWESFDTKGFVSIVIIEFRNQLRIQFEASLNRTLHWDL